DELIKIAFSYFDFIKNKSKKMEQAKTFVLSHIPHMDAKRESRRLVGDYILTQNDCEKGDLFPDRISYGGWPMDVHHPEGIFSGDGGSFWCNGRVPIHTIPYRCLYSKNIDNLLFAGRCASVTHIALGTIRVESTLATLGQAAGTAAALCARLGVNPRGIYENKNHLKKLQQTLLKNDQTIPGIVNEDPDDLARGAKTTASSTAEFVEFQKINVKRGERHPMSSQRGMIVPWPGGRIDTLNLLLRSTADEIRAMKLHIGCADSPEALDGAQDTATAEMELPVKFENWAEFEIGLDLPGPFVWFWLEKAEQVEWALMTNAPPKSTRFYGSPGSWQKVEGQYYAFHTEPPLVVPAEFKPEFAVSGPARKWDGKMNMWASNPRLEMPQWLEVDLGKPKTLNSVYLTFDTNMAPRLPSEANPPEAIRDYRIRVFTATGEWSTVAEITGNFLRRRIHRFEAVQASRIRIEALATNGFPDARIFEIRVYNE
ncbi:MAG: FAD-dependent oxidoreductase, partial [Lentisphaeria bacterium]|nr:FAD-dependent oxidoreductase [Lentisphaeria bacterium]